MVAKEIYECGVQNELTVNTKDTAMIISAKPFIGLLRKLFFGNDTIEFVTETWCCGIYTDNRLKWKK